jgi:hypothetical protein
MTFLIVPYLLTDTTRIATVPQRMAAELLQIRPRGSRFAKYVIARPGPKRLQVTTFIGLLRAGVRSVLDLRLQG